MKKLFAFILPALLWHSAFAFTHSDIKIFTLQSGLTLYFLEDTTTATVRLELNVNASSQQQTPETAGFFGLYAQLLGLESTPDCVKTEKTVAPSQTEKTLIEFSNYFKTPQISDATLSEQLKSSRTVLNDFSSSAAGFINQAIDSRIFAEAPWKQQSGTYPANYNSMKLAQVRTLLTQIKNLYYTPSNASLYVSGNITQNAALSLAEKYFGKISETKNHTGAQNAQPDIPDSILKTTAVQPGEKTPCRFVLTDDELSEDLTQIVLQYTQFTQDEADLISAVFNKETSTFKKLLLKQRNLAIRAADYIDASSAQQKDSSRLVIQAICEKTKVSPAVQGELFCAMAREKERLTDAEIQGALKEMDSNFLLVTDNSTLLMKNLAVFNQTNKDFTETLFNKTQRMHELSVQSLNEKYENARPFVFILCNTKNYTKYQNEFKKYGYVRVTKKNGAWYLQSKYKDFLPGAQNIKNAQTSANAGSGQNSADFSAQRFITENESQFSFFTLKNSIPVTIKTTPQNKTASVALCIAGGELLFAKQNAGLASTLANSLAAVIQWGLDGLYQAQVLSLPAKVSAQTCAEYSLLTVTCSAADVNTCLNTMSQCIIFGDITPALADGITYDLRTQWRIKTLTPDFQLLCEAARTIWQDSDNNSSARKLYDDTKDRPSQMDFTQIQAAYPSILDSTRFSLILTGGTAHTAELEQTLNSTFGELTTHKATEDISTKIEKKPLPKKSRKLQLRHQFFTDVSADKAGPRPAVLIPTTDFSDPLLYVEEGPSLSSTDSALFNALLYLLQDRLQKAVSVQNEGQTVKVKAPDMDFPYAQIIITKIKHTSRTDSLYSATLRSINAELEELVNKNTDGVIDTEKDELLEELENLWLLHELEGTATTEGTAALIQKSAALGNPKLYLEQYKAVSRATAGDYYLIFNSFFTQTPPLRIYSADSKK